MDTASEELKSFEDSWWKIMNIRIASFYSSFILAEGKFPWGDHALLSVEMAI